LRKITPRSHQVGETRNGHVSGLVRVAQAPIADCERRELIALGPTPRRTTVPGATLTRLARGRSIYLAVLTPRVPLTAVGRAGNTVDTVDFGTWDGDCASSWYLSGAF
jgi:hypothetical protein